MPQIKLVHLGDLHVGAVPHARLEAELDAVLFPWLEANAFEAVVQGGDYYDKRLPLDSDDAKLAIRLAVRLCQLCQARGVPLRIVAGGIAHDATQLAAFRPLETEFPVFRVIQSAQHEELLPGFDVLWLPEEYPADYDDFYARFLMDGDAALVYDAILGHGEIDVACGWSSASESERHYGGTPTHAAEVLLRHSSGPVQFAHVHPRFRYKRRLGYPGSFTRWCHGEEAAKGFDVLTLTAKAAGGWDVRAELVENHLAPVYRTARADELLDASDAPDEMVRKLREAAAPVHRLRVRLAGFPVGVEELAIVRGAFAGDPSVELQAEARPLMEAPGEVPGGGEEGATGAAEERRARMSYLRDPALSPQERLLRYISERAPDSGVTIDDVAELTAPLAG